MTLTGYGLAEKWLLTSVFLSILVIVAYMLGLRLERLLHSIAHGSDAFHASALPAEYASTFLRAAPIGFSALVMSLAALVLMIFKPF